MVNSPKYRIEVFWSEDDEEFIAIAPELKGCSAGGLSREEAVNELEIAIDLWLEVAKEQNREIPIPAMKH